MGGTILTVPFPRRAVHFLAVVYNRHRLISLLLPVVLLMGIALQSVTRIGMAIAPMPQSAVNVKINFQPDASAVPAGYTKDIGLAYDSVRGSGWVREDSLSSTTHVPLDITPNSRDRDLNPDQRYDTLLHMQYPLNVSNPTAVKIPAAWEYAVPNGTYSVTVAVGDPQTGGDPENHVINVEGIRAINNFVSSVPAGSSTRHATATITVSVSDGKLTVDAIGGTNTKIDFVEITGGPASTPFNLSVNFQSESAPVPTGYVRDFGESYGPRTGANQSSGLTYGWVVPGTTTSLNLVGNGRDRDLVSDQRLDTLMHMQGNDVPNFSGVAQPGSWELAVPNGPYDVSINVGDAGSSLDSSHRINVEGETAIPNFVPTASNKFSSATKSVYVSDGKLTIDATGGTNTKINYAIITNANGANRPSVTSSAPNNNATNVLRDTAVTAEVHLPNTGFGIDPNTLTSQTVRLHRTSDNAQVPATLNTSGGGDVIVLDPSVLLDANISYTFKVTDGLKDLSGAAFIPYTSSFTTGSSSTGGTTNPASFEKVALPTATGKSFTSLTIGPDGKLYAGTIEGEIVRFPLNADGTTGTPEVITSVQTANGGQRMLIGLTFDPASSASNLILWMTHSAYAFNGAPDWAGKVSRLSGPNLTTVQDYVINLPRSIRDHMTNSLAFGPDGGLYILQGSNTAMGEADDAWGLRPEHVLNAAVLRLNVAAVTSPPLNVMTADGGGSYNPFAPGAPLTIYASGTRNAFDMVWHSNGQLYVPTNGSAAGGNTPSTPGTLPPACQNRIDGAYTGPQVAGITNVTVAQSDFLFRVVQGGYYGHPNPQRCEWVLNGGNPSAGNDPAEVTQYGVGTQPDRNWRRFAFDFGLHYSPNGVVEYHSNVFNGALKGKLLVVRYSAGDDIIALTPGGPNLDIVSAETGITGFTGFQDPLDLVENTASGNLYVSEFAAQKITLLRPLASSGSPNETVSPSRLVYNTVQNSSSAPQNVMVGNTGSQPLTLTGLSITGTDSNQFRITSQPQLPATVQPGSSVTVTAVFEPTSAGPKKASLQIQSNDPVAPQRTVDLRGLGTLGTGGSNEPSLQWILDTYDIPVNVGDPNPADSSLPTSPLLGDEVSLQRFQKANSGPVTIETIAVFGPDTANPTVRFGWYPSGNAAGKTELFTVSNTYAQTLNPQVSGLTSFDPGNASFGFYSIWPFFNNREIYSEDALNTFTGAIPHHVRVYPLKAADGTVVPNAYIVTTEENTCCFDYQDIVTIVRNVKPFAGGPKINLVNLDGVPFSDRLAFSRIGALSSPPSNGVHNVAMLRIENIGSASLQISGLQIAGPWIVTNSPTLPANIAAGGHLDLSVQFRAECCDINNGTLTIMSNDSQQPNTLVQLSGFWQSVSEGGQEPTVAELMSVFGYGTIIARAGEQLNQDGLVNAVGDEVLSPYWQRVDQSKPVSVRQLAAFHTYPASATVYWFNKGNTSLNSIMTLLGQDAQTVLPRATTNAPAAATFTPGTTFGFNIDNEWSDDTLNNDTPDRNNGCPGPCGHHVRFFPIRDRQGRLVPDTWLMIMDYVGINYDYNDNDYLISNIRPENSALNPSAAALYRLDVAGAGNYTDTYGRAWTTDAGFFSPSTAIDEGANVQPQEIAKTDDDVLYRTYRGNVGNVPLNQRVLTYNLPISGSQKVDLRLHFAERAWNSSGQRLFNIEAEGAVLRSNFDIFATAGASNTALVLPFKDINVTDGNLTLVFRAVVDYPSIAGIEVLCQTGCSTGNGAPTVNITSPANNTPFVAPATITINADASDSNGTISKVDFFANGGFIGTDNTGPSPYSFVWNNVGAGNYSLTAVATDNSGTTTTSTPVNVSVSGSSNLPSPWTDQDIGSVGRAGSASYSGATFTVNGSGADIWNGADAFNFVSQPLSGDGQIIARVASVQNTDAWSKAGVMIREDLSAGARNAFVAVTPSNGVEFQRRLAAGGASSYTSGGAAAAPYWVKLVRSGSAFSAYKSVDGATATWVLIGSDTIQMGTNVYIGLAVTSHNNSLLCAANFDNVSVSVSSSLPSPWTDQDIGSVGRAGSASYSGATFTVNGSGADIWNTADAFNFVSQPLSGDGQIIARVASVQNSDPWAKAGVMIREDLSAGSRNAFVALTPSNGVEFQRRLALSGASSYTAGGAAAAPYWLKLVRSGSTFSAYKSVDGATATWVLIGSDTIQMGANVYIGLAVTSHNNSNLCAATFSNVTR